MERNVLICYGSISLFIGIIHNIFLIYHVDVCFSFYKIDKFSFWLSEIIFLIWNSCNDPLFGWLSDKQYLQNQVNQNQIIKNRLSALQLHGPLLAVVFMLFWFKWCPPFLQFVVCLCAYDGFLTMVDLNYSALLADMTISSKDRTQLNIHCSVFSAIGSLFVFLSYLVWNVNFFLSFQLFCLFAACISFCGFYFSNAALKELLTKKNTTFSTRLQIEIRRDKMADVKITDGKLMKSLVKQLKSNRNLLLFIVMNLVQVFHCHFNSNFLPLFIGTLLPHDTPTVVCSFLLGLSFLAPHLNNIFFLALSKRHGVYTVVKCLFLSKLLLSVGMLIVGKDCLYIVASFIVSNRIFTEGTCKLLNLVITDLIDEDFVINKREQPISALIFGTINFLSKPGQTLAPMITTALLSFLTGQDIFSTRNQLNNNHNNNDSNNDSNTPLDNDSNTPLANNNSNKESIFQLLTSVSLACALVQLLLWRLFTLHDGRLRLVKDARLGAKNSFHV